LPNNGGKKSFNGEAFSGKVGMIDGRMHQIWGVRWRGLRKNQPGFDPQPDLDHANVGKKLKNF
jgi:hypothetical protein